MKDRICPVCNNQAPLRLKRQSTNYFQCTNCQTLFSDPIDQDGMIGGEHEEGRNIEQNHLRIDRIEKKLTVMSKDKMSILDFGCGHGMFIADLKNAGYVNVVGYDAYNEYYSTLPRTNQFHIVTMTEVIEHTSYPFNELDWIYKALVPYGCVVIETSFIDVAEQENILLEDFFYIAPQNGHSTIFSHHGLDLLMAKKGFSTCQHFNRHVRVYQKIK